MQSHEQISREHLRAAAKLPAYVEADRLAVCTCGRRLSAMSITEALALHEKRGWHLDVPWTGATADKDLDRRLAEAFRALLACATLDERFRFIEGEVWRPQEFPHPAAPVDIYRETLMRWWLDLFEERARR